MDGQQVFAIVVTAIIAGAAVVITPIVAFFWHSTRVAEQTAVLKKAMLDRGFTAEQIVQVIDAGGEKPTPAADTLIETLADNNYAAEHVQGIQAAIDHAPADQRDQLRRDAAKMAGEWYEGPDIIKYIDSRSPGDRPVPVPTADDVTAAMIDDGGYAADDVTAVTVALTRCPPAARDAATRAAFRMVLSEHTYTGEEIVRHIDALSAGRRPESAYA